MWPPRIENPEKSHPGACCDETWLLGAERRETTHHTWSHSSGTRLASWPPAMMRLAFVLNRAMRLASRLTGTTRSAALRRPVWPQPDSQAPMTRREDWRVSAKHPEVEPTASR